MQIQQPPKTNIPELDVWLERLAEQLSHERSGWTTANVTENKTYDTATVTWTQLLDIIGTIIDTVCIGK